jgi:hypothetical protein
MFFLLFLLDDGSGSGKPKNIWILRIRLWTHCLQLISVMLFMLNTKPLVVLISQICSVFASEFKTDVKTKAVNPAAAKPTSSSSSLAAIFGGPSPAAAAAEPSNKKPRNLLDSLFDPKPAKQTDTVSSDDGLVKTTTTTTNKPRSMFSSLFDEPCGTSSEARTESVVEGHKVTEKGDVMTTTKMEITKVYDFAGEIVKLVPGFLPVLRIRHIYSGSRIRIFSSRIQGHMYSGSVKNLHLMKAQTPLGLRSVG